MIGHRGLGRDVECVVGETFGSESGSRVRSKAKLGVKSDEGFVPSGWGWDSGWVRGLRTGRAEA